MKNSEKNKTINTPLSEGQDYLKRCVRLETAVSSADEVLDKTILGDCLRVMALLPPSSVDLIVADPPYNLSKKYNGKTFRKRDTEEYIEYTRAWMRLAKPLLKETGSIYVCCDWRSSRAVETVMSELFTIRNRITWEREKGRGSFSNWKNCLEDIWYGVCSDDFTFNVDRVKQRRRVIAPYRENGRPKDWTDSGEGRYRDTHPSNLWKDLTVPFWSMKENTAHPYQKPEKLLAKIILASSEPGDVILDPFLGSGTTSVTAKKLSRRYIGIESDPLYCVWAEQRLSMADHDKTIQGYADGVFRERNEKV